MPIGKIMITNGGTHPSDKWAETTAEQIADLIVIDSDSASPEAIAARKAKPRLKLDWQDALEGHHDIVQEHERGKLDTHGLARLSDTLAPQDEHIDAAVESVIAATKNTPFAAHFALPSVREVVRRIIGGHFVTAMDIERAHHADKHGNDDEARAYHRARREHGGHLVNSYIDRYRAKPAGNDGAEAKG